MCKVVGGSTPKTDDPGNWGGDIKWVTPAEIRESVNLVTDTLKHVTPQGVRAARLRIMPAGTVLLTTRAPIGKVALAGDEMCCNQGFKCLICSSEISNEWLLRLLRYKSCELQQMGTGATFRELSKKVVSSYRVKLPAMASQLLTVERLSSLEKLLGVLRRQLVLLDQLVKSRFVEMFGGLNSADLRPLKDVCSIITDGTHQPPKFVDRGIPFLFVSNITSDAVDYETNKFISVEDYEQLIRRTPIEVGDVLVSAVGSFGHPAIVEDDRPFCFQRHIAYLKPRHDLIDSSYLHAALLSEGSQRYMDRCAKGAAQRTVTLKSFKEMKVPLPPLALQQEFASFVAEVDKSRFIVKQKIEKLQMLYDSLAQEYFG